MATNDVKVSCIVDKSLIVKAMAAADELDEVLATRAAGAGFVVDVMQEKRDLELALAKLGEAVVTSFVNEYRQGRLIRKTP